MQHSTSLASIAIASTIASFTTACAGAHSGTSAPLPHAAVAPAAVGAGGPAPIAIPVEPKLDERPRVRIATGLANPRGMHMLPDGSLLVATAGTGDPASPLTGALLKLTDLNRDGDYDDAGERTTLLGELPSKNILEIVRRDEVFGMAGMAEGGGAVLVSLAFFGGPSKILRVADGGVAPWATTNGNINDLAFDPVHNAWFGASSTTDEVVRLSESGRSERVVKFPPLASGQDAVPGYLRYDPLTHQILVSLFSGSPEGEEGGEGVELVPRAASIVRVDPDTRSVSPAVTELTVPTDLEITDAGVIFVLEFCDSFVDPVPDRQSLAKLGHGGFRRFSGRLLKVDRIAGQVSVLARGLDAPTNMTLVGGYLYIAQGMGTPGRPIPGPSGEATNLTGFIERIGL